MTETKPKKRFPKIILFVLSFITMGALVDVSAVTSLTCLIGIACNPNPITGMGDITLLPANDSFLGGVYAINCTSTNKLSQILTNGTPICSADVSGSGGVTQITLGEGLTANQSPILTNATIYLLNATPTTIGGIRVGNCSVNNFVNGFNSTNGVTCNGAGTVTSITQGVGLFFRTDPITTTGIIDLANASSTTIGGVIIGNCTSGNFINGFNNTNGVTCGTPTAGSSATFQLLDRVYFSKTKTNVGTAYVDVYNTGLDPEDTLLNTTGMTQIRILVTVDYVGAGTTSSTFNQSTSNVNSFYVFNYTADCDPCDSNWQNLPAWASNVEVFIEPQIKSTTSTDDPIYKGHQIWLR